MQNTIRTTVRLREDLLNQSKLLAIKKGSSVQKVINDTLAKGFGHISDIEIRRDTIAKIDQFRKSLTGKKINIQSIVDLNKEELDARTRQLLRSTPGD